LFLLTCLVENEAGWQDRIRSSRRMEKLYGARGNTKGANHCDLRLCYSVVPGDVLPVLVISTFFHPEEYFLAETVFFCSSLPLV